MDIWDADVEEAADPVRIARRLKGDRRLVVGGSPTRVDDDEAVGEGDVGRFRSENACAAEDFGVEAPGALEVIGDDEVAHHHSFHGLRWFGHWFLRLRS